MSYNSGSNRARAKLEVRYLFKLPRVLSLQFWRSAYFSGCKKQVGMILIRYESKNIFVFSSFSWPLLLQYRLRIVPLSLNPSWVMGLVRRAWNKKMVARDPGGERRDYRLSPRVWIMRCSHNAKIWLANAGALTTRCQRAVNNYDEWSFAGLLIWISEIDSLKPNYRSFAIASRRRWCPHNSANSLRKEFEISSVLFGKVFLKPKCKNQVPWPDQPDDIFPLPLV